MTKDERNAGARWANNRKPTDVETKWLGWACHILPEKYWIVSIEDWKSLCGKHNGRALVHYVDDSCLSEPDHDFFEVKTTKSANIPPRLPGDSRSI